MALKYTPNDTLGTLLPEFTLPDTENNTFKNSDFKKSNKLVIFMCNHCPYVIACIDRLVELANHFSKSDIDIVAISSNDAINYPEDSFEEMGKYAKKYNLPFPYLYDESQDVARSFGAVCTPDIFLYNSENKLVYRGQIDDNWKSPEKVTRKDLKIAIEHILNEESINFEQTPSMGCSIKWKF